MPTAGRTCLVRSRSSDSHSHWISLHKQYSSTDALSSVWKAFCHESPNLPVKFRTSSHPFASNLKRIGGATNWYTFRVSTSGVSPPSSAGCSHQKNSFEGKLTA